MFVQFLLALVGLRTFCPDTNRNSSFSITPLESTVSAASPPTTGHLTTPSSRHWPARVSDSCPSDHLIY